jgi:hypothetical protein
VSGGIWPPEDPKLPRGWWIEPVLDVVVMVVIVGVVLLAVASA